MFDVFVENVSAIICPSAFGGGWVVVLVPFFRVSRAVKHASPHVNEIVRTSACVSCACGVESNCEHTHTKVEYVLNSELNAGKNWDDWL